MKLAVVALLAVAGCDWVYGLPDRPHDAGTVDAGPAIHVTGTFVRPTVLTNQAHVPFVIAGTLTDDDRPVVTSFGQVIPIEWNAATGAFSFDAPVPYEVAIAASEWQARSPTLAIDDVQFARPGAVDATSVSLDVSLDVLPVSIRQWELISTGVWTRSPITFGPSGSVPFLWSTANFYSLGPRLLSASAGDVLYLASYGAGPLSDSLVLNESAQATIEMQEGTQAVTFNAKAVGIDGCAHIVPTSKADVDRVRNTYPGNPESSAGWEIDAVPALEYGVRVPHLLHQRYSTTGDSEVVDVGFGQPYTGFSIVLSQITSVARMLGDVHLASTAVYQDRIILGSGCFAVNSGGGTAPLPINPKLAGVPLKNDNLSLGVSDDDYAEITWDTIGNDPDLFYVELFEAPATGQLVPVRIYMTGEPRVRIAKRTLEPGKRYITRISTRTGRPGPIDGDFTRYEYPTSAGVMFTSAFTLVQ